MRKLLILATMAALLVAVSASAGGHRNLFAEPNATFQFGVGGAASGPSTTNNDDSCDIGVAPAATLLLPYFEVDFNSPATTATTTLFTITNTSDLPQIAHVVIWSDFSFPVLDFNIFLTGYDVQAINMWDILNRGIIGTEAGTSVDANVPTNPTAGSQPADNIGTNPNFLPNVATQCAAGRLPGRVPPPLLTDLRAILTTGRGSAAGIFCAATTNVLGATHTNAIGYVTVDVAATCSLNLPNQAGYFTGEILFDNVLIGDYQQLNPNPATGNFAGGSPMVHIRAIPEGGPAGSIPIPNATNLPFTFYDRYTNGLPDRQIDRRQPLPVTFAARYIQGGTGNFNTDYKIWREGFTGNTAACTVYVTNANIGIAEIVRFDERENATTVSGSIIISPPLPGAPGTNEAQRVSTSSGVFPPMSTSGDVGGWMYLNLNNGGDNEYSAQRDGFQGGAPLRTQSQNWVIVSMFAEGRFSVDFDAAWLGNGCSTAPLAGDQIGPAGGTPVCPPDVLVCVGNPAYDGTNTTP